MGARDFTRNERRYLSRFVCAWCEQKLSSDDCSAVYERCTEAKRDKRRRACLKLYKPRAC